MSTVESPAAVPEWDLADRLIKARRVAQVRAEDMAEYLGVSRATVSNFERGTTEPRIGYLRLWAQRCDVP